MSKIPISKLCLANGDEYDNVTLLEPHLNSPEEIFGESSITVVWRGRSIVINPEFIILMELGGSKPLGAI